MSFHHSLNQKYNYYIMISNRNQLLSPFTTNNILSWTPLKPSGHHLMKKTSKEKWNVNNIETVLPCRCKVYARTWACRKVRGPKEAQSANMRWKAWSGNNPTSGVYIVHFHWYKQQLQLAKLSSRNFGQWALPAALSNWNVIN